MRRVVICSSYVVSAIVAVMLVFAHAKRIEYSWRRTSAAGPPLYGWRIP